MSVISTPGYKKDLLVHAELIDALQNTCCNKCTLTGVLLITSFITLWPRQDGGHFAYDIFECIFLDQNFWILNNISFKYVPSGPIDNMASLDQSFPTLHLSYYRVKVFFNNRPIVVNLTIVYETVTGVKRVQTALLFSVCLFFSLLHYFIFLAP